MITKVFNILMICIYLGMGIYFLLINKDNARFSPLVISLFGSLLIVYGIFRLYRLFRSIKEEKNEKEE